ncbi:hypothetical protein Ccar_15310 [Clostridium carboxidivorans P7]|uniref:SbsA Ig-like domain-containing protein n=1 Tax=Clostridium carboxidivorans P7 TaxID=536227 RepID=C6Q0U1_9CLOT|nr:Ig-like domain-containing protein [Clostridium carboxidivorans]AKN32153.1 hypothetical protein Ccar_15310 [Clostridium carboxidivorans P7]EET84873.1 hypothetical protein CcarbDRAFT_4658 [Clostridium carboxidivorans P7]
MNKIFKIWELALLISLSTTFYVSAKELPQELNVSYNKPWCITFNESIDPSTISGNIIITDNNGKKIKTNISVENNRNGNFVIITPVDKYNENDTYTISINKNVKSYSGHSLKEETTKKFTVMNTDKYSIDTIKNEVNEDFNNFKLGINMQKSDYGLKSYEDADDIYMDKGFEYYYISSRVLDQESPNLNNIDDIIYSSNRFIFFNKINGRSVCSASVYYSEEGKWKVFQTSGSNFYDDIVEAEREYSLKDGDFKLVNYDLVGIRAMFVTTGNELFFINLSDKAVLNQNKFKKESVKKFIEDFKNYMR